MFWTLKWAYQTIRQINEKWKEKQKYNLKEKLEMQVHWLILKKNKQKY